MRERCHMALPDRNEEPFRTARTHSAPPRASPAASRRRQPIGDNGGVTTPERSSTDTTTEVRVRRAPRLPVFLLLGAVVGAIATLIITGLAPADPKVGFAASYGYFCLYGVPAGVLFGALLGLALDRRSVRKARVVTAEREQVETRPPA